MRRESQVRFCERAVVKLHRATLHAGSICSAVRVALQEEQAWTPALPGLSHLMFDIDIFATLVQDRIFTRLTAGCAL